jgi:hypothetical protein
MKYYLFLLLPIFIVANAYSQTQDTIRFENLIGLIKIPVQINGKVHYFMFDTGAEVTAIREDVAAGLDKTNFSRKKVKDSNNEVTVQSKFVVKSLKIGNSNLSDQSIHTFPNSPLFNCSGFEGIIGIDIIKQFDWLIDFDKQCILKTDPSNRISSFDDFIALDFYKNKFRPMIKLKIGSKTVDFLFDTGATESGIDRKNYRKIRSEIIKSYDEISSVSGANSYDQQSIESFFLVITQPSNSDSINHNAMFNTISVGENKIGNDFWGQNQLFLSWSKGKLLFRTGKTEKKKTFGISFRIVNESIVVNSLVYTGQIIKSGVKTGDKVKTINGKSYKEYCELLMYQLLTKENIYTIEMQDGKQFTLKKEDLY